MTEQTRTDTGGAGASAGPGPAPSAGPRGRARRDLLIGAAVGLCLGLLALGPGLAPGYLLSYDMVYVPRPAFNAAIIGASGTLPRAVPSDAVVAVLARIAPADLVQKGVLLAIFVLACAGAARLLASERLPAQLAAGVFYAWNPFVAERLILGQWATLLGYAGLPWVLAALIRPAATLARRTARLGAALLPAAVGGFAAMLISALVAVPVLLLPGLASGAAGRQRPRPAWAAIVGCLLGMLSLPWLVPALARHVAASPAGVAAFAARADTPFGTLGSLVLLGGGWNAQTEPAGYGGLLAAASLALAVAALAGFIADGRRRWPGLAMAAAVGVGIALLGGLTVGQHVLGDLIRWSPGFAVLRDGQQFVAPLALAEALGLGLVVARVLAARRPALREATAVAAAALVAVPVVLLPGQAFGAAGRLRPVEYPADWLAARRLINADPRPGKALLLPWAAYRRFGWNHGEAVLDPWPRLLNREVVWNDGVQVGATHIPPEDPAAVAISNAIDSGGPLTGLLRADGYRYVIADAGGDRVLARLAGCRVVLSGPGLLVCRLAD